MNKLTSEKKYLLCIVTIEKDDFYGKIQTQNSLGKIPDNVQWLVKSYSSNITKTTRIKNILEIKSVDKGIYNAMNGALEFVDAEWVLFLNSGDCLVMSVSKLVRILQQKDSKNTIVLFNWLMGKKKGVPNIKKLRFGSAFSHQAAVISAEQFMDRRYNEEYKLAADYDFFIEAMLQNVNFLHVPITLSRILPGGVSDVNRNVVFLEFLKIQNFYSLNKLLNYINYFKNIGFETIKSIIKKFIKE